MSCTWRRTLVGEIQSISLGRDVALWLGMGDLVGLRGPVGAGKSVLARAIIRALAQGAPVEVPSPTFTLVETYADLRVPVTHFDLYRIEDPGEVAELGLDDALARGAALVEWPERLGGFLPRDYLQITLSETQGRDDERVATLTGVGTWAARLERAGAARDFVARSGWGGAGRQWLKGDASSRSYQRLVGARHSAILMDAPAPDLGPPVRDAKPYATIAGLATDTGAFLALNAHLRSLSLSAPRILSADAARGFVLLEDFGNRSFGSMIDNGEDPAIPYRAALAVLARLHEAPPPAELPYAGGTHKVPVYDLPAMLIEADLLVEWLWPAHFGAPCPGAQRALYRDLWSRALKRLEAGSVLVLRDFHTPNLFWLPEREGTDRVGIIDHQDAVIGHPAYDLMSLAQDARTDLAPDFEQFVIGEYRAMRALGAGPDDAFGFACALLGAQRSAKILGIFARLDRRDGKPGYLGHIPRMARYLARNLAHPDLGALKAWFDTHFDLGAVAHTAFKMKPDNDRS